MRKQSSESQALLSFNVGTSLILVTFILICLVAFGGLSFSSAQSDYQLSLQTANRKQAYFDACKTAEENLAILDTFLDQIAANKETTEDFFQQLSNKLATLSGTCSIPEDHSLVYSFTAAISEKEQLLITVIFTEPDTLQDKGGMQVIEYKATRSLNADPDEAPLNSNVTLFH